MQGWDPHVFVTGWRDVKILEIELISNHVGVYYQVQAELKHVEKKGTTK